MHIFHCGSFDFADIGNEMFHLESKSNYTRGDCLAIATLLCLSSIIASHQQFS